MVEAIAIKLLTVLAGYVFENTLAAQESINIQGAPGWYMKPSDSNMIWVYAFVDGGPETVETVEKTLNTRMQQRIEEAIEVIIYDNFRNLKDPAEIAFVDALKTDPELAVFVRKHIQIHKLEHYQQQRKSLFTKERPARSFGGAKLPRQALLDYQRERLGKLTRSISLHRADKGFGELGMPPSSTSSDPFADLPPSGVLPATGTGSGN
jgi:hypothetical protein